MLISLLFIFIIGSCIGSFINVVVYRLPIMLHANHPGLNLCWPRSFCPDCKSAIKSRYNIPIIGYLILKGQSQCCKQPIRSQYLLIEILCGLLATLAWITQPSYLDQVILLTESYLLIALIFIDREQYILPNCITYSLLILALASSLLIKDIITPQVAFIGAALNYVCFYLFNFLYKKIRGHDAFGGGDIKLSAAIGALLGFKALPLVLLLASSTTLLLYAKTIIKHKLNPQCKLPFGPGLCVATLFLIYCSQLINI